jgi:hypothetical protein
MCVFVCGVCVREVEERKKCVILCHIESSQIESNQNVEAMAAPTDCTECTECTRPRAVLS